MVEVDQKTKKEILQKIVHKTQEYYEKSVNDEDVAEADKALEEL